MRFCSVWWEIVELYLGGWDSFWLELELRPQLLIVTRIIFSFRLIMRNHHHWDLYFRQGSTADSMCSQNQFVMTTGQNSTNRCITQEPFGKGDISLELMHISDRDRVIILEERMIWIIISKEPILINKLHMFPQDERWWIHFDLADGVVYCSLKMKSSRGVNVWHVKLKGQFGVSKMAAAKAEDSCVYFLHC